MARRYRDLRVFQQADSLVMKIYPVCNELQAGRHWALANQLGRSSLSVAANIVEGSARSTQADYLHFLHIALGSASESSYLLSVARRAAGANTDQLEQDCDTLVRGLQRLIDATRNLKTEGRRP